MSDPQQQMLSFALGARIDADTDLTQFPWKPFAPGIESATLHETPDEGPAALLLRYQPGARGPMHVHQGYEHILILSGSQTDHRGRHLAGSLLVHAPGTRHQVHSEDGCVVLAIWERRVRVLDPPGTA